MQPPTQAGGAAAVERPSCLATLVAEPERFAAEVWDQRPLYTAATALPGTASRLFSAEAVDELVSTRGLRTPFLRMARDGATLNERDFTAPAGVGAGIADQLSDDKLLRQFADGATMVLQGLHRTWEPLLVFTQDLAAELGHPVQVNGYITPPQSQGFDDHYDVHDVFVVQVAGTKHWRVRPPVHPRPLRNQPWTDRRGAVAQAATKAPQIDVVLAPGDTLYLPRGWLHSATAMGGVSIHLTIGVHPWTRHHLLEQLLTEVSATLATDPALRTSLPVGTDVTAPDLMNADVELARKLLLRAVAEASGDAVVQRLTGAAEATQRAAPVRPLAQLAAADALADDVELRLRAHLATRVDARTDGTAVVHSRAGRLEFTATDWPRAQRFFRHGTGTVAELGPDLARRLLLAGVALPGPRP